MLALSYFVSLLGYGLVIKTLLPRLKLGVAIFCAFICMAFFSYTFMIILGVFAFSAYLLIFGGIFAFIIIGITELIKYKKRRDQCLSKSDLFTILVYLMFVSFLIILLSDGVFKEHDAYSFWGRAARELYVFDKGYFNADTNIAHWDYNPLFATMQYAVTRVFGWQTKYVYYIIIGMFTTGFCAIMEFIEGWKQKLAFLFLTILFYPMIVWQHSTTCLGADASLALLFVTGVLCWQSRENEDIASALPTILAAVILPAVKLYSGLMLSIILVIMLFTSIIKNKKTTLRIALGIMLAGILYMQCSWSAYYNYNVDKVEYERAMAAYKYLGGGVEPENSLEKPTFKISYFIKGNPRTEKLAMEIGEDNISEMLRLSKQSIDRFVDTDLYNSSMYIVTLVFLSMFAYTLLAKVAWKNKNKEMLYTIIWIWVATIIYVLGMFATYLVQPETEGSVMRYIGVVVIPMVISLLYYTCKYWKCGDEVLSELSSKILLTVLLILILDCKPRKVVDAYSAKQSLEYGSATYVQNEFENELKELWAECSDTDRILIIDNNEKNVKLSRTGLVYAYQYYALPKRGQALYFEYGNKEAVETVTGDYLKEKVISNRIDTLIVMIDDEDLQKKLTDILTIPVNNETQIIDVAMVNGDLNYSIRGEK